MQIEKNEISLNPKCPFRIDRQILKKKDNRPDYFHWHTCFEITFVEKGRGRYFVASQILDVSDGDIILFNNLEPHGWEILDDQLELLVMVFMPEYIAESASASDEYLEPFVKRGSSFKNRLEHSDPLTQQIGRLMREIESEDLGKTTGYPLMIRADVLKILSLLFRYFQDTSKSSGLLSDKKEKIQRLSAVFQHMNTHFQDHVTLYDAAEIAFMSPNYFSTYFRKVTGQTFSTYLNHLRVEKAEALLLSTDLNILEIAEQCGFSNMSNFYRIFKKVTGQTPTTRRKEPEHP